MLNQNGINILASFLSLEKNTEYACFKPTLNRQLPYAMLSKQADLY